MRKKLAIQEGYGFGCDIVHFDPTRFSELDDLKLRSELGIPSGEYAFIFVGRLTAFKGFPLAMEAFQLLQKKRKDVHFLVVGEADPLHPLELPDLNTLEGVHHVGWKDDPAPYLAISDAMVFPSEREGMPVCVMEALSMGLRVIGCATRGCYQLKKVTPQLVLVDREVVALSVAFLEILKEERHGSSNLSRIREIFSREKYFHAVFKALFY